jgi:NitT/TauT family transport system substrate-binding protein
MSIFSTSYANSSYVIAVPKTPLSLPFYVAQNQGFFKEEGLSIEFVEVMGGMRSIQLLNDGKVDFAICSEAVVMFQSLKREDFSILASFVSSNHDVKLIVNASHKHSSISQLKGKKIGVIPNSASQYYLDTLLILNGIDPKLVTRIPIKPEQSTQALESGQIDAMAIWEPHIFQAQKLGAIILQDDNFYQLRFNLVMQKRLVNTKDKDLIKLLQALLKAQQYIDKNANAAKSILRSQLGIDSEYINWFWNRYHFNLNLHQSLITTMESEARWALQETQVHRQHIPNFLNVIYSYPLRQVLPNAVNIIE